MAELGPAAGYSVASMLPVLLGNGERLRGAHDGGNGRGQGLQLGRNLSGRIESEIHDIQVPCRHMVNGTFSYKVHASTGNCRCREQHGLLAWAPIGGGNLISESIYGRVYEEPESLRQGQCPILQT